MKTIWIAALLIALVSIESSADGQLIPRRNVTRPCPTYRLPSDKYEVDERSRSVSAFSFRYIYPDDLLDKLNLQPAAGVENKTEIVTVSTERVISNGNLESKSTSRLANQVSQAIAAINAARIEAQAVLITSQLTSEDIAAAREKINQARLKAEENIFTTGLNADDISAATIAIDHARLMAEETLLTSLNDSSQTLGDLIARVQAARRLAQEKLLSTGKVLTIEQARLQSQQTLFSPGKTVETVKKTTQQLVRQPADAAPAIQHDQKLFQWSENRLKIDHCEISNMAVQLSRSGECRLNLRADQNRTLPGNRYNPSLYIKRNQFGVVLRCYGNMATARQVSELTVGQPVLAEIKVDKFWVQNGKPTFLVTSESAPAVEKFFDLIDRVEIEFFYYK